MESHIKLGRLFGIEIGVNYSWFIILFLTTFFMWNTYHSEHPEWPASWQIITAIVTSFLFFASLLAHELSHSLLALAKGLPVHSITLFIFGGVSRIEKEAMNAATEFWVGGIGPISSAVIAGLFYLLEIIIGDPDSPMGAMASWLAVINLSLALFNLIPGFPLDGGRMLRALIWWMTGSLHKATRVASAIGQGFAYLLIVGGIIFVFAAGQLFGGLWTSFIGWFLLDAARSSEQAMVFERAMKGARARDVMSADVPTVPAEISLSDFFDDYLIRTGRRCFIVMSSGRLVGLMTTHELKAVPRELWTTVIVGQMMKPFETMRWVEPNAELRQVLEVMENDDLNQVPVVSEGRLEGLIRRENVLRFIKTRAEFNY